MRRAACAPPRPPVVASLTFGNVPLLRCVVLHCLVAAAVAWADSQVNANNRALKVCGTSDCEVVFQGQINSSPWASDATFQALVSAMPTFSAFPGRTA